MVGIVLCSQKDASVVRYSVLNGSEQLFANKLVLPSEDELRRELDRERASLMGLDEGAGLADAGG